MNHSILLAYCDLITNKDVEAVQVLSINHVMHAFCFWNQDPVCFVIIQAKYLLYRWIFHFNHFKTNVSSKKLLGNSGFCKKVPFQLLLSQTKLSSLLVFRPLGQESSLPVPVGIFICPEITLQTPNEHWHVT